LRCISINNGEEQWGEEGVWGWGGRGGVEDMKGDRKNDKKEAKRWEK
jgi:hypothetical protein